VITGRHEKYKFITKETREEGRKHSNVQSVGLCGTNGGNNDQG